MPRLQDKSLAPADPFDQALVDTADVLDEAAQRLLEDDGVAAGLADPTRDDSW
jgi:hypothetical protein